MFRGLVFLFEEIIIGKDYGFYRIKIWSDVIKWVKEWDREVMDVVCYDI